MPIANCGVNITLTPVEVYFGELIGKLRHKESMDKGLKDSYGFSGDGEKIHISGACGEIAAAKSCAVYWEPTVNTFKLRSDIGDVIQVRTRSNDTYDLIVRPDDNDGDVFILVIDHSPVFNIKGWFPGYLSKQPELMQTYGGRPPAYFVPQRILLPMGLLSLRR